MRVLFPSTIFGFDSKQINYKYIYYSWMLNFESECHTTSMNQMQNFFVSASLLTHHKYSSQNKYLHHHIRLN